MTSRGKIEYPFNKIESFSISKKPEKWTRRKYPIIYGRWGYIQVPIAYITKPKWIEQAEFEKFIEALELSVAPPRQ